MDNQSDQFKKIGTNMGKNAPHPSLSFLKNYNRKVTIACLQGTDILGIYCETPGLRWSSGFIQTISKELMDILFYCILLHLIFEPKIIGRCRAF